MSDSSSDDLPIERVVSPVKGKPQFDAAPRNVRYLFKLKDTKGKSYCLLEYTLMGGKKLPYITILKDKMVQFDKSLEPTFGDMLLLPRKDDSGCYVFQDTDGPSEEAGEKDLEELSLVLQPIPVPMLSLEELLMSRKNNEKKLAPFSCFLCASRFVSLENSIEHVGAVHPDWQLHSLELDLTDEFTSLDHSHSSSIQSSAEVMEVTTPEKVAGSVHSQLNWFSDMESSYMEKVIGKCSQKVRDGVEENLDIESLEERRVVSREILDETLQYVHGVFGNDNPRMKNAAKIASLLATVYPAMFKFQEKEVLGRAPSRAGYGLGGIKGLKNLPSTICQRYHDKFMRTKRNVDEMEDAENDEEDRTTKKRGRAKVVYGVSQKKWYAGKITKDSVEALKLPGKISNFEDREETFNQNRAGLMEMIRNSTTSISKVCDGFYADPRHLEGQFNYLTESSISDTVRKGLVGHLENLEEYLLHVNSSVEFTDMYEGVIEDCSLEFDGSLIHKYIYILRWAGDSFDGEGSAFLRLVSDGPPKSPSPHILAVKVGNAYVFELWAECGRILHNMDLADALSAFLHLCFTFNLKYPQKAEFLCDFLQRAVAMYGDTDGTKTSKAKSTAENKLMRYYVQLGKALGAKNVNK